MKELPTPYYQSDRCTLYCGDCLDILPLLAPGSVDAVVTDPPYGIAYEADRYRNAKFSGQITGDSVPFDPSPIVSMDIPTIIWGGNNFADRLPIGGWLCWDKRCVEEADRIHGSPFEMAWCSDRQKFKMLRLQHCGAVSADREPRVHPTQKPIGAMEWCIRFVSGNTILDPFMGSGTTGVAAIRLGRKFIGIELEEKYCAIAARRIKEAEEIGQMFREAAPQQMELPIQTQNGVTP